MPKNKSLHILVESPPNLRNNTDNSNRGSDDYNRLLRIINNQRQDGVITQQEFESKLNRLNSRFSGQNGSTTSQGTGRDDTFIKEAKRLASMQTEYGRVNITPYYNEPSKVDSVMNTVKPGDSVSILGHSGAIIGGMSAQDMKTALDKCPDGTNMYLGSCSAGQSFGSNLEKNNPNLNVYRTNPQNKWYGPSSAGKDFIGQFFGLQRNDSGDIEHKTPEEGKDYSSKLIKRQ